MYVVTVIWLNSNNTGAGKQCYVDKLKIALKILSAVKDLKYMRRYCMRVVQL